MMLLVCAAPTPNPPVFNELFVFKLLIYYFLVIIPGQIDHQQGRYFFDANADDFLELAYDAYETLQLSGLTKGLIQTAVEQIRPPRRSRSRCLIGATADSVELRLDRYLPLAKA